ncbi:WD40 repeat-like protein [Metschnikowia bicuspidata var. bicuspidata NRRL YB-4993]|uniref:WD40 repeat-like protein n=1 Tax=Metschnikowia bicuspidata var. bicuspidata NRRL YB-4993 TaxID=869754 RepID=A0A1A0HHE4_9ASCO|nr:WD40 repeat-like protein [Metschnikowia bicuspidata var. bicuspidata NRRL YB-4993]OBA23420.1 WD40 repeat-like protein [Metschnikowia bicuspidata var. bicuspidata NRRL YB-4993]
MKVLHVSFNQDQGCFSIAHEGGFLVYNTNPIDLRVCRKFSPSNGAGTGIGLVSMLHRTNYLAMVGGGRTPKFPNNKVIVWDDIKQRPSLTLSFMSPVLNVLLSRIRIIVVLLNQVIVYGFSALPQKIATYETIENEHGLADLSILSAALPSRLGTSSKECSKCQILAFPGRAAGQIQLVDVSPEGQEKKLVSIVKAHKSKIRFIALNRTGTLVASASESGTIIRVHSTQTTALVYEFRRGLDRAVITSMRFSSNDSSLAVFSDKNTLHVFNIASPLALPLADYSQDRNLLRDVPANRQHMLNRLRLPLPLLDYFQSTWSFCSVNTSQYHVDFDTDTRDDSAILGWSGNDTIIVIWKKKKIWEKYVIVEDLKDSSRSRDSASLDTSSSHPNPQYKIVRSSWKSYELTE